MDRKEIMKTYIKLDGTDIIMVKAKTKEDAVKILEHCKIEASPSELVEYIDMETNNDDVVRASPLN
jgi:hypothetical protein